MQKAIQVLILRQEYFCISSEKIKAATIVGKTLTADRKLLQNITDRGSISQCMDIKEDSDRYILIK